LVCPAATKSSFAHLTTKTAKDTKKVSRVLPAHRSRRVAVCGPPAVAQALKKLLRFRLAQISRIFTAPAAPAAFD
jgi:NAD(P)H-flavin reductase